MTAKEMRLYRIEHGMCVKCTAPVIPGTRMCEPCRLKSNASDRERRKKRKAAGICLDCMEKTVNGRVYCEKHRKIHNEATNRNRAYYRKIGICPYCYKNKLMGNEGVCPECLAKSYSKVRIYDMEHREERRQKERLLRKQREAEGRCTSCGREREDPEYKMCSSCRQKSRIKQRMSPSNYVRITDIRKAKGLCIRCENPALEGLKVCETHRQQLIKASNSASRILYVPGMCFVRKETNVKHG